MNANQLITKKEDERIDFLMKLLQRLENQEARIKKELRSLIYKIEKR